MLGNECLGFPISLLRYQRVNFGGGSLSPRGCCWVKPEHMGTRPLQLLGSGWGTRQGLFGFQFFLFFVFLAFDVIQDLEELPEP